VATGLDEPAGVLSIGGDAYIRLLQMTVLPYVLVSLTRGLGGLDAEMARRIGLRGGGMILALWSVTLATVLCLPLAYPDWTSAAFFSTSLLEDPAKFDPLTLYIPANPFYSLGHTIVPAVVAFSIALGLALIPVQNKKGLLNGLTNLTDALMKIASFVGKLAPLGIFAIAASAAGTLRVEELNRLQVFLWVYLVAWTALAFVTLPLLVAWATPFSYREALRESQVVMITAFATGTVLVVLPMIVERCRALLEARAIDEPEAVATVDVLVPTAYSFPSAGTLLGLGFVLFAAWYVGAPLSIAQYPSFTLMGALTAFGSMAVAIPFMLGFFSLPADLFQLYLLGSVVTARFGTALAAMHGVVVCLLGVAAVLGRLRMRSFLQAAGVGVLVTAGLMFGLGIGLTRAIPYAYTGEAAFVSMSLLGPPAPVRERDALPALDPRDLARPRLDVIRERGTLRAGYLPDRLPFAYRSVKNEIVGFDLDLLHALARDLGVTLELLRLDWDAAAAALGDGRLDIAVGGIAVTPGRAQAVAFTRSYMDRSVGFALRDNLRDEYPDLKSLRRRKGIRVALIQSHHYRELLERLLPNAEIVPIDSPRAFFRGQLEGVDLLALAAESGSAWTLIYPEFSVMVPREADPKIPTAMALPIGQVEFLRFVDTWLDLSQKGGLLARLNRYWILGEQDERQQPRWSVMSDLFGWGRSSAPAAAPAE